MSANYYAVNERRNHNADKPREERFYRQQCRSQPVTHEQWTYRQPVTHLAHATPCLKSGEQHGVQCTHHTYPANRLRTNQKDVTFIFCYVRQKATIPQRLRSLVMLRTAVRVGCPF